MNYDIFFASITIVIPLVSIAFSLRKIVDMIEEIKHDSTEVDQCDQNIN
jgi:hypothetical protein